jgi:hypothetical protein
VNRDEAKIILQLYRTDTADAEDPQIAEALALAKSDSELARWLEEHCALQSALREKFRQIEIPAGLKEQIISEQAAFSKRNSRREKMVLVTAVTAIVAALAVIASLYFPRGGNGSQAVSNTLANYQNQMAAIATSGYGMDFPTNDLTKIRAYLAQNAAPSDYTLPVPLEKTAATGCAIEGWQGKKVSMICFRTGKPLPPNQQGDLWLFVVDRTSVKNAPDAASPQFAKVNQLTTATWTQGGKLYLLATEGDEQALRKFL